MRAAGESLSTALVDQETGIRGYAISGRPDEPRARTATGAAEEQRLIAEIDGLLRPRRPRASAASCERGRGSGRTRGAPTVAEPVLAASATGGPEAGQALIDAAATEHGSTRCARAIDDCRRQIQRASATRPPPAPATPARPWWLLRSPPAVIIVLAGAALLLLLDRLVSRPVIDLADAGPPGRRRRLRPAASPARGSPELVRPGRRRRRRCASRSPPS